MRTGLPRTTGNLALHRAQRTADVCALSSVAWQSGHRRRLPSQFDAMAGSSSTLWFTPGLQEAGAAHLTNFRTLARTRDGLGRSLSRPGVSARENGLGLN